MAAAQVLEWAVQRDINKMAKEVMLLPAMEAGLSGLSGPIFGESIS